MTLRLWNWKRLLLKLGAGVFLCASIGCTNSRAERGPNLNAPIKSMGPGNQVMSPASPAFNNIAGQGQVNQFANAPMNRGMPTGPSQFSPGMNQQAAFGQQNAPMHGVVVPSQYVPQQGFAPNGYPQPNPQQQGQPAYPQQQGQPVYQQPPLINQHGPAMSPQYQGMPTSMSNPRVPEMLPTNAREAATMSGPTLMPVSHSIPAADPVPSPQKEASVRVLGELSPRRKPDATPVTVTPITDIKEPPAEAPVFYPR